MQQKEAGIWQDFFPHISSADCILERVGITIGLHLTGKFNKELLEEEGGC